VVAAPRAPRGWGSIRRRGDGWFVDIHIAGERCRVLVANHDLAEKLLAELRERRAMGSVGAPMPARRGLRYREAIAEFRKTLNARDLSARTRESYGLELDAVDEEWSERIIARTRPRDVEAWTERMRKAPGGRGRGRAGGARRLRRVRVRQASARRDPTRRRRRAPGL